MSAYRSPCIGGLAPQLHIAGTEGPTMVWHREPPGRHSWQWASHSQHVVLTVTPAQPPRPWIELRTEGLARFRYPTQCLTHKSP